MFFLSLDIFKSRKVLGRTVFRTSSKLDSQISVIYKPISEEEISNMSKGEAKDKLGLDFEKIFLFVGSLTEKKNPSCP